MRVGVGAGVGVGVGAGWHRDGDDEEAVVGRERAGEHGDERDGDDGDEHLGRCGEIWGDAGEI